MVVVVLGYCNESITSLTIEARTSGKQKRRREPQPFPTEQSAEEVHIITDSKQACRDYANGIIAQKAEDLLNNIKECSPAEHETTSTPSYEGLPGNKGANAFAHELPNQTQDEMQIFTLLPIAEKN